MILYKKIYENSIDDFFDNDSEEVYYEGSIDPLKDSIEKWLEDNCDITGTYTINEDYSIDVDGNLKISNKEIEEIPDFIKIKNVSGNFDCSYTKLKSLKGSPESLEGNFTCYYCNSLKNLIGGPINLKGEFECSFCESLESLEGAPRYIEKNFLCYRCGSLKNLIGSPIKVEDFDCSFCESLESLEGSPKEVKGLFDCSYCNLLESLEGAPEIVGHFDCSSCSRLISLEGCPSKVYGDINCVACTSLKSLKGAPEYLSGKIYCNEENLDIDSLKILSIKNKIKKI